MLMFILEAALRSTLMALAVWAAIRLLRVQAVLAQKVAWVLVLAAAASMPLLMHAPWLAANRAVQIPLEGLTARQLMSRLRTVEHRLQASFSAPAAVQRPAPAASEAPTAQSDLVTRTVAPSQAAVPSPIVRHPRVSRKLIQAQSTLEDAGRALDLPVSQIELSVKLPASLAAQASFWSAGSLRRAVSLLYAAVVAALLLRTLFGLAVAGRLLQRSRRVHILSDSGQPMRVRSSAALATPITIGRTILLPADYAAWDAEKLRVVLAHESSHVRQGDFYLQLAATLHAAIFWFSPLGWWLKRKLSDLGEALSDRAALEHAEDAASYAQVLLEFAAAPRRAPLAGVAMARRSNLSSRIERILNDRRFQLAFLGGRRHAILAALLVPAALVATVAGFRVVPAVHAARSESSAAVSVATTTQSFRSSSSTAICAQSSNQATTRSLASAAPQEGDATAMTIGYMAQDAPPTPPSVTAVPQAAPVAPAPDVVPPAPAEPPSDFDQDSDDSSNNHAHAHTITHSGDDGDSFSIVHAEGNGTHSHTINVNGDSNHEIARVQKKLNLQGNYIWFERDGKSYIITDPAVVEKAYAMFREDPALERQQKILEDQQKILEKQMANFDVQKVQIKVESPEFKKQMADLNAQIAKLQSDEFKKHMAELNKEINQEVLSKLQEQVGSIQEQIGELQGQIGEQMGKMGEQQGRIGEKMGELGEQMGRIGEEQGRRAEEATRKMQSVLDQALREGKAKPVQ